MHHPVLGPLLVFVLAVLLAMTALHESHESVGGHPGEFCVALVGILLGLLSLVVRVAVRVQPTMSVPARSPPIPVAVPLTISYSRTTLPPLRL